MHEPASFGQHVEKQFHVVIELEDPDILWVGVQAKHELVLSVLVLVEDLVVGIDSIFEILHLEKHHPSGGLKQNLEIPLH